MSLLEFRRTELPPELDLGDTFHNWRDGATYRVKSIRTSSVSAERVTEPPTGTPDAPEPARQNSVLRSTDRHIPQPKEVVPAAPSDPPEQEAGEPIDDKAPATGKMSSDLSEVRAGRGDEERPAPQATAGDHAVDEPRTGPAIDAEPAAVVEPVKAAEIADIPPEHDLATKADVMELAARVDLLILMMTATLVGIVVVLWKLLR